MFRIAASVTRASYHRAKSSRPFTLLPLTHHRRDPLLKQCTPSNFIACGSVNRESTSISIRVPFVAPKKTFVRSHMSTKSPSESQGGTSGEGNKTTDTHAASDRIKQFVGGVFGHGHSHSHGGGHSTWDEGGENDFEAKDAASHKEEMHITKVGFYWNVGLTLSKFTAGVLGNSLSLVADAFHSVSDMLADGVTMLTIKYASAPADTDHPYGHGRIEDVGTLTVSGIVLLTGLGIGWNALEGISQIMFAPPPVVPITSELPTLITNAASPLHETSQALHSVGTASDFLKNAATSTVASSSPAITAPASTAASSTSMLSLSTLREALFSGDHHHGAAASDGPTWLALLVAGIAVLSKEYLFRVTRKVAQRTQSRIVEIHAWHHRSDAASSMIALVGIAGSMMKWPILDPLAALIVGAVITKQGFDMGLDVYHDITDRQMPYELSQSIERAIYRCAPQGVKSFHGLRGRRMGRSMLVDVSIVVPSHFSVSAAHQAAEAVRTAVMATRNGISECMVHVDVDGDVPHHSQTQSMTAEQDKQYEGTSAAQHDSHYNSQSNAHGHSHNVHKHEHADADSHVGHTVGEAVGAESQPLVRKASSVDNGIDLPRKSANMGSLDESNASAQEPIKSKTTSCYVQSQTTPLMRPYYELEEDVKRVIMSPEFQAVSYGLQYWNMVCHFVAGRLTVTVELILPSDSKEAVEHGLIQSEQINEDGQSISVLDTIELRNAAEAAKSLLKERIPDVDNAHVLLRLV